MKKLLLLCIAIVCMQTAFSQEESAFESGEWFKFKMSYSNWFKAGNATLTVKDAKLADKDVYHVVGKGWTTGMIKWFFKERIGMRVILINKLLGLINLLEILTKAGIPKT